MRSGRPQSRSLWTSASHEAARSGLARTPTFSLPPPSICRKPSSAFIKSSGIHHHNHQHRKANERSITRPRALETRRGPFCKWFAPQLPSSRVGALGHESAIRPLQQSLTASQDPRCRLGALELHVKYIYMHAQVIIFGSDVLTFSKRSYTTIEPPPAHNGRQDGKHSASASPSTTTNS